MNKKIYIYGAGAMGKQLYLKATNQGASVAGFIDKYKVGNFCGLPIFSISDMGKQDYVCIIISIQNLYTCVDIYKDIKNLADRVFWYWEGMKNNESWDESCLEVTNWGDCVLPRMDMHLSDKCNLNCVGCTHFSPLYDAIGCTYDKCIHDIDLILSKYTGIARLNLLGGEPLLNPDLLRIVPEIRKRLPNTTIVFFTNGLLLCKVSELILKLFRDNNIKIYISEYKPTHKIIDRITDRLNEYEVSFELSGYNEKLSFNKPLSRTVDDRFERQCMSNGCISVSNGKIARCPTLLYVEKLNQQFKCDFPTDGIYDLEKMNWSGMDLLNKLAEKVPLCDFCIKNEIEWQICDRERKLSDFVQGD